MKVYPSICLQGFYIFLPSDIFNEFIIISLASLCFEWAEEDIVNRHTNKSSILKSISKQKETCVRYWSRQLFLNAPNDWIISLFLFFFSFFQNSTIYGVSLWWKAKRQSRKSTCFFFFFGSYIYFSFFFSVLAYHWLSEKCSDENSLMLILLLTFLSSYLGRWFILMSLAITLPPSVGNRAWKLTVLPLSISVSAGNSSSPDVIPLFIFRTNVDCVNSKEPNVMSLHYYFLSSFISKENNRRLSVAILNNIKH